jgi:hypothetical protein
MRLSCLLGGLTDTRSVHVVTIGSSHARATGLAPRSLRVVPGRSSSRSRRFGSPGAHVPARRRFCSTALVRLCNPSVDRHHTNNRINSRRSSTPSAPVDVPAPDGAKSPHRWRPPVAQRGEQGSCGSPLRERTARGYRLCLAGIFASGGAPACSFPSVELGVVGAPDLSSQADAGGTTTLGQDLLDAGPLDPDAGGLSVDLDSISADATVDSAAYPSVTLDPDGGRACAAYGAECTTAAACCSGACGPNPSKMGKSKGACAASCVAPTGSCSLDAQCCFPFMCRLAGPAKAAVCQ